MVSLLRTFRCATLLLVASGLAQQFIWAQPTPQNATAIGTLPTPASPDDNCKLLQEQSGQSIAKRDYSGATDALQKAAAVCPNRKAVLLALAQAQMLSKQFDAALASLAQLLMLDPADADGLATQGEVFYLESRYPEAIDSLQKAIAADPTNSDSHYVLGRIYYAESNVSKAMEQFQQALKLDASAYKTYDGLALCYESQGNVQLASQTYMKGIELVYKDHPSYDTIYADFAEFLLRYGSDQKAFDLAAEAASRNPREPRNFFLSGKALYKAGHLKQSLEWLTKSAEMDHSYPDPHYILAQVYTRLGEKEQASREIGIFEQLSKKVRPVQQ
jgi:tetratricopeptide (TPR) repeat protein